MNKKKLKYPLIFLRFFCKADYLEEIEGDLLEQYNKGSQGKQHTIWWLWVNVIKLIRPGILKSFLNNKRSPSMIKHHIKVSFRSFQRYKTSFLINYAGLVGGLVTVIFIYLWVNQELNVDRFHHNDGEIYRLVSDNGGTKTLLNTNSFFARELADYIPEIEYVVNSAWGPLISHLNIEESVFATRGEFGTQQFFELFTYPLIVGDPATVLNEPNAIVLSESMALRLFNSTDIVGKRLNWRWYSMEEPVVVTGIFKDLPDVSSEQFDYVLNFTVYEKSMGERLRSGRNARTYLKLASGASAGVVNQKIFDYTQAAYPDYQGDPYFIINFADYYLENLYENGKPVGGRIELVRLFIVIGILVLIIACINFMNLATARATLRMKEIGIRKTLGALRGSLISQFLTESFILSTLAGLTACCLIFMLFPLNEKILDRPIQFSPDLQVISGLIAIIFFTGLLAGSYPALFLSGFSPLKVLKKSFVASSNDQWFRKGLVVFQFGISLALIIGVVVVYQQMHYVQTKNLGYDHEYIINFRTTGMGGSKQEAFLNEVHKIPGVVKASGISHSLFGAQRSGSNITWDGKDPGQEVWFEYGNVGYHMLELLGIELLEGRYFSKEFGNEETKIVINQSTKKLMGVADAVGKKFTLNENEYEIIGVTDDFHFQSLHEPIKPTFFLLNSNNWYLKLAIKIQPESIRETLLEIDELYTQVNPGFPFQYSFHDQDQSEMYETEVKISALTKYAAGLAILISSLGLFGLVSFVTAQKAKEMGIRKILGASPVLIFKALTKDFILPIMIATVVGVATSALLIDKWLDEFAYRIDLKWWFFVGAIMIMVLIAFLTAIPQVLKTVMANPVNALKDE